MCFWFDSILGKLEGCPKSEQSRLQTPERKTTDMKDKQASYSSDLSTLQKDVNDYDDNSVFAYNV